jgi:hypothetical protein
MTVATITGNFSISPFTGRKITLVDVFGTSLEIWANETVQRYSVDPISIGDRNLAGAPILQGNSGKRYYIWNFNGTLINEYQKGLLDDILLANQKALRKQDTFITGLLDEAFKFHHDTDAESVSVAPSWATSYPVTNDRGFQEGYGTLPVILKIAQNYAEYRGSGLYSATFSAESVE